MKVPLRYQMTTYDCGPTTLLNAFSYLYEMEEIPAIIMEAVWRYTLDCFNSKGDWGEGGTSRSAMRLFATWLKEYAKSQANSIKVEYLEKEEITYHKFVQFLQKKGVVVVRCYQSNEHYVLITKFLDPYFYLFDPYYVDKANIGKDASIVFDWDHPFEYNRMIHQSRLFSETKDDFSLGPIIHRESILIMN